MRLLAHANSEADATHFWLIFSYSVSVSLQVWISKEFAGEETEDLLLLETLGTNGEVH